MSVMPQVGGRYNLGKYFRSLWGWGSSEAQGGVSGETEASIMSLVFLNVRDPFQGCETSGWWLTLSMVCRSAGLVASPH